MTRKSCRLDETYDEFEFYENSFDAQNRQLRRSRKPRVQYIPKKSHQEIVFELVENAEGLESGFKTTYRPSRYEAGWLLSSLRTFYDQALITDVEALVKGGKEASVYRCAAHPSTGLEWLAAKVYRPQKFRNLRNDKVYRKGRSVLTADGHHVHENQERVMRALDKKSAFGLQVARTSWLMYEQVTLECLYAAGAAVPTPVAAAENALLMTYYGDQHMAAPTLSEISLERAEAEALFQLVLENITQMIKMHLVHGDLSAYNILYWDEVPVFIDFPQVVNTQANDKAYALFCRDIQRVCAYFAHQGVACDPVRIASELWQQYADVLLLNPEADAFNLMMAAEDI